MADIGTLEVTVRPTVTLESAVACVAMLNMFLESDESYVVIQHSDGKLEIVEAVRR